MATLILLSDTKSVHLPFALSRHQLIISVGFFGEFQQAYFSLGCSTFVLAMCKKIPYANVARTG